MGRDTLNHNAAWFKRLEDDGILRDEMASLGWGIWLWDKDGKGLGYLDEHSLRTLADEIERRNKPFWDGYNAACALVEPDITNVAEEVGEVFT